MKKNAELINEWANQQCREKKAAAENERDEEKAYAVQTETITRMRGMLEDEMTDKRNQMMKEMQAENKRLALEKKQREAAWKGDQATRDKFETTLTQHHEVLDEQSRITRQC